VADAGTPVADDPDMAGRIVRALACESRRYPRKDPVRTYVRAGDRRGVYFFSLDAGSTTAVLAARRLLNLPYFRASMSVTVTPAPDGRASVEYLSARRSQSAEFRAAYGPIGPAAVAAAGTLEHFLVERYCLYHVDARGRPYRLEIHHPPWALQAATARITHNTMAAASGVHLPGDPVTLHFAARQDVVAWSPDRVKARA
jgi:uncharacterized protein YqjF (DUF2071 family)